MNKNSSVAAGTSLKQYHRFPLSRARSCSLDATALRSAGDEAPLGAHDTDHIADRLPQVNVADLVLEGGCVTHFHLLTVFPLRYLWAVRAIAADVPLP